MMLRRKVSWKYAAVGAMAGLSLLVSACVNIPLGQRGEPPTTAGSSTAAAEASPAAAPPPGSYVLILDSSGSMKTADMIGGGDRITAAREAAKLFVTELPAGSKVALITYGDQTPEDAPRHTSCGDVTVKIPLSQTRDEFTPTLDGLKPSGWSPISAALTKAAELAPPGERTSIVLVSDGEDSCAPPDPCDTASRLVTANPGLSISTIGLRANNTQLACIAERGTGISVTADTAIQLARRLPALSDPGTAADQLSPNGLQRIRPGTAYTTIKEQHPDFPTLPEPVENTIRVTWRNCTWEFDNQHILRGIMLNEGSTIDGIKLQDPTQALDGLGTPVQTEPINGGELRYYAADERLGLAWRVTITAGKITTIVLCNCLPVTPCPPPNEDIRRIQNDPTMDIRGVQCTADRAWAVVDSTFESRKTGGYLILQRQGTQWQKVKRVTHGGDCFSLTTAMPLEQLVPNLGGMCDAILTKRQFEGATLTTDGFGPLKIGMSTQDLQRLTLAYPVAECQTWETTEIVPKGLWIEVQNNRLSSIFTIDPAFRTASGARVGMTLDQIQRMYPGKLQLRNLPAEGGSRRSYVYVSGKQMVEFSFGHDYKPSTTLTAIGVSTVDRWYVGGC